MLGLSHTSLPRQMAPLARSSTVDLIARELRQAIFTGGLPVGAPVREVEISSQLGVSRAPFREAAQRLVQEGILTASPGRGLRVTRIVGDAIDDVYDARLAVESRAVLAIAESRNAEVLSALRGSFEVFAQATELGEDAFEIGNADLAFHQLLVDFAGSYRLSRMMSTLVMETRLASFSADDGFAVRLSVSPTYEALLSGLELGNTQTAVSALEAQFRDAIGRLRGEYDYPTMETEPDAERHEFNPIDPNS
ncbi:GntR family transcriptional regulator [Leucobacter aridicollis]|uniref:GntR family transcriptional regulator n=1 Tax=Leucobacter aridicollis TaxID=283878 RepID=UPI0021084EF9|nr:GntR family transcriptional regulator [Leucobacter aridicollis]UTX53799.1 GntR family transcriptional regulator [Leucobacter aridicollis]